MSTKYLQLYVSYFAFNEKNQIDIKELLKNNNTWDIFTNPEKIHAKFIANKSVRTYMDALRKKSWKLQNWNEKSIYQYAF